MNNVLTKIKIQVHAGEAKPASTIGPALGQHGVNIMSFCKKFNEQTKSQKGFLIPVVITVYKDKSFDFITKTPPTTMLIKKSIGLMLTKKPGSGAKKPGIECVGTITLKQIAEIALLKKPDLNVYNINSAINIIKGTAKSMGVKIVK